MTQQHIWTWPVILTLCISVLALVIAGGSLTWQVISWRRIGPRVGVKLTMGIGGDRPIWFVAVEARNSGRIGTEVQQFGLHLPNGHHIQNISDFLGQPVQFSMPLGPGGTASMTYPAADLRRLLREQGISGENVRPYVNTGHGRFEGKPIHLGERIANL
jgi:hypothetical protein